MDHANIFTGVSGAFWSLTYALIAFTIVVAAIGGDGLTRIFLMAMAAYSIVGLVYGAWAAQVAVARARKG